MPGRKIDVIEEVKKKYVRMALETGRQASIARKAGISSKTLRKWIREYEGEIREAMESEESPTLPDQPSVQALQEQLDKALALLGQKELENAILKRLLKKNDTP
jgi:transposase-like protein